MPKNKLTPKQERFCREYLIDLNASQAAIRAGYSKNRCGEIGWQLLQKTTVKEKIIALTKKNMDKLEITNESVLREFARAGFSDIRKYVTWGAGGVEILEAPEPDTDESRAVSEISETKTVTTTKDGDQIEKTNFKFKLHDKVTALTQLGRHLSLFHDKLDVTTHEGLPAAIEEAEKRIAQVEKG